MARNPLALSLFWRTFFLLALLLASGVFAWVQTLRALEFEPRAVQSAQQTASLVNLARAALNSTDGINRVALIKGLSNQQALKLAPREPKDKWEPYETDRLSRAIGAELRSQLGPDTLVASSMNGTAGLFVGFSIERDPYWLQIDPGRVGPMAWSTLSLWVSIAFQAWLVTRAFGILIPMSASFLVQAMLVIGVAVPTPGAIGSFHEAYRIAVTTFFHAPNSAAVSAALVLHAVSFLTSVIPGVVIMAKDGTSVAGLGRLAGVARQEPLDMARSTKTAGASADEMPVLRPSGR